jgi:hypothetical protein
MDKKAIMSAFGEQSLNRPVSLSGRKCTYIDEAPACIEKILLCKD